MFNFLRTNVRASLTKFLLRCGDQYVLFLPTLNLTAYGNTESEADEMLQVVVEDYFQNLLLLTEEEITRELELYSCVR